MEVKRTAARNFGWGLALIGLALVGILPLSNRMTRDVGVLQQGADRIAADYEEVTTTADTQ